MVSAIQRSTGEVVTGVGRGVELVDSSVAFAGQAGDAIARLREMAQRVAELVGDVDGALREQSAASTEVAKKIEDIATQAEEASAIAHETSRAAESMASTAHGMEAMVSRFRVWAALPADQQHPGQHQPRPAICSTEIGSASSAQPKKMVSTGPSVPDQHRPCRTDAADRGRLPEHQQYRREERHRRAVGVPPAAAAPAPSGCAMKKWICVAAVDTSIASAAKRADPSRRIAGSAPAL